ncbi:transposase, partial [Rhodococcus sp. ANT_H53B]
MDRDQQFLLPVDMREWLPASDPVFTVIDVVTALDTSAVHAVRRTGGVGRAGYDPDMLLTVLIFGWAQGQRSSRVLERLCQRDAAFRIICAGNTPDHVTISRFRADVAPYMDALFTQVLLLCGQLGLARLGVVALDGVKISSDASLSANRTEKGLRAAAAEAAEQRLREHARAAAAEHAAADAAEDEMFGPGSTGDEVP